MSIKTPLGRVLGHGSAKQGVNHWWIERLTGLALLPLTVWFLWSLLSLPSYGHADVVHWIAGPWTAVLLMLFVLAVTWHSQLGVQVVIEDYVHGPAIKFASTVLCNFAHVVVAAASLFAILKIAFGH
jgi:succinate dehydrogenase / fumarate reductase, membrane anchor subunit